MHNYNLIRVTEIRENDDFPACMLKFAVGKRFAHMRIDKYPDWNRFRPHIADHTQENLLREIADISGVIQIITGEDYFYVIKSPVFGWRKIFERLRHWLRVYDYGFLAYHSLEEEADPEPLLVTEDSRGVVFHVGRRIEVLRQRMRYDRKDWYGNYADCNLWLLPGYRFVGYAFYFLGPEECNRIFVDVYSLHLGKNLLTDHFDPKAIEAIRQELLKFLGEEEHYVPLTVMLQARKIALDLLAGSIDQFTDHIAQQIIQENGLGRNGTTINM